MGIQAPMAQGQSTQIISMIKWIRTSRLSIKSSLSLTLLHEADLLDVTSSQMLLLRSRPGFVSGWSRCPQLSLQGIRVLRKMLKWLKRKRGRKFAKVNDLVQSIVTFSHSATLFEAYRGTSLIRDTHHPRITIGPWA